MSLLDQNTIKYFLKWKGGQGDDLGFKDCEIQKADGMKIGKLESKGFFTKKNFLYDNDNSSILNTIKKTWSWRTEYKIKYSTTNQILIVKGKFGFGDNNMIMKNPRDENFLRFESSNNMIKGPNEIKSVDGKIIARFSVTEEKIKERSWKHEPDNSSCTLEIFDPTFDRKILLGMFICCLSSYIDWTHGAG